MVLATRPSLKQHLVRGIENDDGKGAMEDTLLMGLQFAAHPQLAICMIDEDDLFFHIDPPQGRKPGYLTSRRRQESRKMADALSEPRPSLLPWLARRRRDRGDGDIHLPLPRSRYSSR